MAKFTKNRKGRGSGGNLDRASRGNDQLKTNVALEMRSHHIEFQTV